MNRKKTIHFISLFLLPFLLLLPQSAFPVHAAEEHTVVLSKTEVLLDADFEGKELRVEENDVTLDLNGQTISLAGLTVMKDASLRFTGTGQLTISGTVRAYGASVNVALEEDGGVIAKKSMFCDHGTLTLESGTLVVEGAYLSAAVLRVTGGELIANTRYDGVRTTELFQMEDGNVSAHGGIHGIHAQGEVNVTGGALMISGGQADTLFEQEQRVHMAHEILVYDHAAGDGATQQSAIASTGATQQTATTNTSASVGTTQQTTTASTGTTQQTATTNTSATAGTTQQTTTASTGATQQTANTNTGSTTQVGQTAASAEKSTTRNTAAANTSASTGTTHQSATVNTGATTQQNATANTGATAQTATANTSASTGTTQQSATANTGATQQAATANMSTTETTQQAETATTDTTQQAAQPVQVQQPATQLTNVQPPQMGADLLLPQSIALLVLSLLTLMLIIPADKRNTHR